MGRVLGEMHEAAGRLDLFDIGLDVEIEMLQGVVLDLDGFVAQRFELRQRVGGDLPFGDEALFHIAHRPLQLDIGQRLDGMGLEVSRSDLHGVAYSGRKSRSRNCSTV